MVKLLQAMAAFFNFFIYFVLLVQNQQLCGGSSPASLNRAGGGSFQHMEAYRCPTKNLKVSEQRAINDERQYFASAKIKIQRSR